MSTIQRKYYTFDKSTSPDVEGYNLYYGESINGDVDFEAGEGHVMAANVDVVNGEGRIDLHAAIGMVDGVWDFGVAGYDASGNVSDIGAVLRGIPLDFTPPNPPTNGHITDS